MIQEVATLPNITLYSDGLKYDYRKTLSWLSFTPTQKGFTAIEHVNAIEIAQKRSWLWLIIGLITTFIFGIGLVILLWWCLRPSTALVVYSEGKPFVTLNLSAGHQKDAEKMIEAFRHLKQHHMEDDEEIELAA